MNNKYGFNINYVILAFVTIVGFALTVDSHFDYQLKVKSKYVECMLKISNESLCKYIVE